LGNHKWTENIGSFTKNPIISKIEHNDLVLISTGMENSDVIVIIRWFEELYIIENIINMGRDAVTVYNIRYILAWTRSGWYPHNIIMSIVGTREASNQI
jgi:hypothetical protein